MAAHPAGGHEFQFTPLREGRRAGLRYWKGAGIFQFTPLREGRRASCAKVAHKIDFNSRPCVRGDIARRSFLPALHPFQFTPLREGRLTLLPTPPLRLIFQFTPLREGRRKVVALEYIVHVDFNSRPCVRGDEGYVDKMHTGAYISIHAPA